MIPLNNNDPYIDSTGKRSTLGAKIAEGSGGDPYELPTASANTKGGIKIGSGLTMDGEKLNVDAELPPYDTSDEGKVLSVNSSGNLIWGTPGGGTTIGSVDIPILTDASIGTLKRVLIDTYIPSGKTPIGCYMTETSSYTERDWIVTLSKDKNGKFGANFFIPGATAQATLAGTLTVFYI